MAADPAIGGGERARKLGRHITRFDARDADAHAGKGVAHGQGGAGEGGPLATIAAQVDSGEDYFARAGIGERPRLDEDLGERKRARLAARHMDDAVGAGVVAAVLDLESRARGEFLPEAHGRHRIGACRPLAFRRELVADVGHGRLPADDDPVVYGFEVAGMEGSGTAGDEDARVGMVLERASDGLAGLLVGFPGYGAGVNDDRPSPLVGQGVAAGLQLGNDRIRFDAVDLASQIHEGKPHRSSPSS